METPLPSIQEDDERSKFVFGDRSLMVTTPPPSYNYAVSTSRKHDDPWLSRMNSLDETVLEMRRVVQETQSMMMEMQTRFQTANRLLLEPSKSDPHDSKQEDDDSLDRITESLQQLIEQAQISLKTKMTIRDKSTMMSRSNSCPHMSTIYSSEQRRQSETNTPPTPQPFDWNDQRERYYDSQTRLTRAVDELVGIVSQDSLSIPTQNITVHHEHHHIHEHYHHYHQQDNQKISRMLSYAWSSLRQQLSSRPAEKQPLAIHPPHVSLSKPNLLRFMLYISLLIFSFMNQSQLQLSKNSIAARRCLGQFVSNASDNLPITTWIQRSTMIVYLITFI
ncbi:hypothetical protein BJV82DRAFT_671559 [Fennellomyces sp. T-0311]|nr:hypothetical protein BJV82DRAFT_671559 [Fennellomyces sp. T-0311]